MFFILYEMPEVGGYEGFEVRGELQDVLFEGVGFYGLAQSFAKDPSAWRQRR